MRGGLLVKKQEVELRLGEEARADVWGSLSIRGSDAMSPPNGVRFHYGAG